jgi:hypothetical protein
MNPQDTTTTTYEARMAGQMGGQLVSQGEDLVAVAIDARVAQARHGGLVYVRATTTTATTTTGPQLVVAYGRGARSAFIGTQVSTEDRGALDLAECVDHVGQVLAQRDLADLAPTAAAALAAGAFVVLVDGTQYAPSWRALDGGAAAYDLAGVLAADEGGMDLDAAYTEHLDAATEGEWGAYWTEGLLVIDGRDDDDADEGDDDDGPEDPSCRHCGRLHHVIPEDLCERGRHEYEAAGQLARDLGFDVDADEGPDLVDLAPRQVIAEARADALADVVEAWCRGDLDDATDRARTAWKLDARVRI